MAACTETWGGVCRVTFREAVSDFYRIAVQEGKRQAPNRLEGLAAYCIERLAEMGLDGAKAEVLVPGLGRVKKWDVAWSHGGRVRLAISLKSILRNQAGTVPNRTDDLMGEAANAQLVAPEIVLGYLVVFDVAEERGTGTAWSNVLEERLENLSHRSAPTWGVGMVEADCVVRVNFANGPAVVTDEQEVLAFLETLATEAKRRNPAATRGEGLS